MYKNKKTAIRILKQEDWKFREKQFDLLRDDFDVVKTAVEIRGWYLKYASNKLKNNPEIVKSAINEYSSALEYASKELRNNPEIAKFAASKHGCSIRYASKQLRNNFEIALIAVKQDSRAFKYLSKELKDNPKILIAALEDYHETIELYDEFWSQDDSYYLKEANALIHASTRIKRLCKDKGPLEAIELLEKLYLLEELEAELQNSNSTPSLKKKFKI